MAGQLKKTVIILSATPEEEKAGRSCSRKRRISTLLGERSGPSQSEGGNISRGGGENAIKGGPSY